MSHQAYLPVKRNFGPRRIGERSTECGDASACLKLRIPLIRRDPLDSTSKGMPGAIDGNGPKPAVSVLQASCDADAA
jgi:hypothetical protein